MLSEQDLVVLDEGIEDTAAVNTCCTAINVRN